MQPALLEPEFVFCTVAGSLVDYVSLNPVATFIEAVGLTAAVSEKLSANSISANVIAAYYHDHIFVQSAKADMALSTLNEFRV